MGGKQSIEFKTDLEGLEKFAPVKPAKYFLPHWFKDMNEYITQDAVHEKGKPNYQVRDQLFVHGEKIFYYHPQSNKLYNFDLFDCKIAYTRTDYCMKIFQTNISVRKRGHFLNLR